MTPPSPPPMTRTFLGFGWLASGIWAIISWYLEGKGLVCDTNPTTGSVRELITLSTLDNAVEDQDVPEGLRFKDKNVLIETPLDVQDLPDF